MRYVYPIRGDWTPNIRMPIVQRWRLMNRAMQIYYGRRKSNERM